MAGGTGFDLPPQPPGRTLCPEMPETRYARSGDGGSIAYQVVGDGPFDVVLVPGFISHVELVWTVPSRAEMLERLATFSRLVVFDKRGTGMSDRVEGAPTLEARMDDVRVVMDAAATAKAAILGVSEGVPMSLLFAASHPERTWSASCQGSWAGRGARILDRQGSCGRVRDRLSRARNGRAERRPGRMAPIWGRASLATGQRRYVVARGDKLLAAHALPRGRGSRRSLRRRLCGSLSAISSSATRAWCSSRGLWAGWQSASCDFRKRCLMAATRDRGAVVSARRHAAASAKPRPAVVRRRLQRALAPGLTDPPSPSTRTRCTSLLHSERRPRPGPTFPDDDRESCLRVWARRKPTGPLTSRERP
jgi:pimeloyl-ACP methyl ester carboxylesterase